MNEGSPKFGLLQLMGQLIAGLAAMVLIVLFFAPMLVARSHAYDQYVCTVCGLRRVDDIRKCGQIVYHHQVSLEETAVSRAINAKNCPHNWLLYRYGHSLKRPFYSGFFADGGSPSSNLQTLLVDRDFARELSRMQNPSKSWASLVSALNSNRAFDGVFASWWQDSDHVSFSVWAATNGLAETVQNR